MSSLQEDIEILEGKRCNSKACVNDSCLAIDRLVAFLKTFESYETPEKVLEPSKNNFKEWPDDWPFYKQACFNSWSDCCDMLVGPCKCGAWHQPGEFEFFEGKLYRYNKHVPTEPRPFTKCKRVQQ